MNIFVISSLLAFLSSLIISLVVILKGRPSPKRDAFIPIALLAGIWCLFPTIAAIFSVKEHAIFWVKVVYISALFTGPAFLSFGLAMAEIESKILGVKTAFLSFIAALLLLPVLFSNQIISDVVRFKPYFAIVAGPLYPMLIFFFGSTCLYSFYKLLMVFSKTVGEKRNQIRYVFIAYFLAFFSAVVHFASAYGLKEIFPHDFLVIACMALVAYAIVRHQLMDIEVVIRRTAVFAGLFAFVYGVFTIFTILGQEFFKNTLGRNQWIATIPIVAIITFALRPLEIFLTNVTEKFLFQKKYDYRELLKSFTSETLTVLDLGKLTSQTVESLIKIIKLESAAVLLHDKDAKVYKMVAGIGAKEKNIVFKEDDLIVDYLKKTNQHILKDKDADKIEGDGELKESFKKLNASLCLPIEFHDNLIGILSLGMKKSGEDFTQEDIDILNTLATTEAIAISNAQQFEENAKMQAVAAQNEKMAVIGTLAAGINHEICNPLGIVRGQCEMFLLNSRDGFYNGKSSEELLKISSEIMNKVIKETDRATSITKKLSTFAKPSKRNDLEEVQVEKETEEVIGLLGHDLKLSNIDIQKDFPNNFPIILADKKQIQEVLFNIIRNAAQAMDKKQGKIVVSGFADNGNAVIRIADNGSGIPQDKLGQIFNPFYTTKAPGKGTGLGLFIVKQVVEKNKGTISLESELGTGTTFTLRFPSAATLVTA